MDEQKDTQTQVVEKTKSNYNIPLAIIIAGVIIAGALIYTSGNNKDLSADTIKKIQSLDNMRKITKDDHIRGDIDAKVKIVEYSDLECPYCKQFSITMNKIISEYGNDKKVAHIYRHFPLEQLHSKAKTEAVASECVWDQKGNDGFWKFVERVYEITPSNDGLDINLLPEIAQYAGADKDKFLSCMNDAKYLDKVNKDIQNADDMGGGGTPFTLIVTPDGKVTEIGGAQPYAVIKQMIDMALGQ